jgi:hypothetical protein
MRYQRAMTTPPELYRAKLHTAEEAVALIPDGAFAVQGNAVGEPPATPCTRPRSFIRCRVSTASS